MMKKVIYNQFGDENILETAELPIPRPGNNNLLIQVKAVSINPLDWKIREGEMKLVSGKKFPRGTGIDFSGIVIEAGSASNQFNKSDEIFGLLDVFEGGALAEYILVQEQQIERKPPSINFEKAAALPVVGLAALQIFDKLAPIKPGMEILINGASGGIGLLLVQLYSKLGAIVTAVTRLERMDKVKELGAAKVINFGKDNVMQSGLTFDAVVDLSGRMNFKHSKLLLKPSSVFVNTVPGIKEIIESFFNNFFSKRKYKVLLLKPNKSELKKLLKISTDLDITVDQIFPFEKYKEAFRTAQGGGISGKIVLSFHDIVN